MEDEILIMFEVVYLFTIVREVLKVIKHMLKLDDKLRTGSLASK